MSLRPPLHVLTFQSRTVVSMFGRLCHLFVHALSSLQVANAQCMTLRSLAPCLRAALEKHRFAAGKKHRNGKVFGSRKKTPCSGKKLFPQREKNASKKCRFAAGKIQSSRKNTLQQHKSTFAAEKMHFGGSGKNPGKNPSEARKKPAEAGKKPAAEKVQLCNRKSCRNGKNTFPQRESSSPKKKVYPQTTLTHCRVRTNQVGSQLDVTFASCDAALTGNGETYGRYVSIFLTLQKLDDVFVFVVFILKR